MIIYALSHPITDEVRYVGKSECGLFRPRQHGSLSNLKKIKLPVVRWINKLKSQNLEYKIEVVEECQTREALNETEKFYISYFRSLGFRLLNICSGGEGFTGHHKPESIEKIRRASTGRRHTPEACAKISKSKTGVPLSQKHRESLKGPRARGRILTKEHCENISKGQMGKKISKEAVVKMAISKGAKPFMDQNGTVYLTQMEAGRAIGVDQGSVRQVLKGASIQTKGYVFKYLDELSPGELPVMRKSKRKYGITPEEFNQMLELQKGKCKVCEGDSGGKTFHVDHCHRTGEIRGLLCTYCDTGIGSLKDSVDILKKAILYLENNKVA